MTAMLPESPSVPGFSPKGQQIRGAGALMVKMKFEGGLKNFCLLREVSLLSHLNLQQSGQCPPTFRRDLLFLHQFNANLIQETHFKLKYKIYHTYYHKMDKQFQGIISVFE